MYGQQLTSAVEPKQWFRLAQATQFYKHYGYNYVNVPWLVQQKVSNATKPATVAPMHHHVRALNHTFHIIASGEQGFLQLQYDQLKNRQVPYEGRLQTITPCYRDEMTIDKLHRIGFMKLELIDWDLDGRPRHKLDVMIDEATEFFGQYLQVYIKVNELVHEHGFDIVSRDGLELGSYGIRKANIGGFDMEWIYGTGLAEPRLTEVIKLERERNENNRMLGPEND